MTSYIDYFYTCTSPFTWFGQSSFAEVAAKHKKDIRYKPVNLMEVWKVSGGVAPPQRPPMRQRYRLLELQRIGHYYGLEVIAQPNSYPANPERADCCCILLSQQGKDPGQFLSSVGEALWSQDRQIADESVLIELLDKAGFEGKTIVQDSKDPAIVEVRKANSQEAVELDVVGAPAYVYKNEVFWGQDRIAYLDHMIETDRDPIT